MRSLFRVSWYAAPDSSPRKRRRKAGAVAVERATCAAVEALETRVLFAAITATMTPAVTVNTLGQSIEEVELIYVDPNTGNLPMTGFAGTNITVTGPLAPTVEATPTVVQSAGTATAVYAVDPNGGGTWDASDNGTYSVSLNAGVTDSGANAVNPAANIGTFLVAIPPTADVTPPATVTSGSVNTVNVVVTYNSPGGTILASSLGTSNITVNGPTGNTSMSLNIASISPPVPVNAGTEVETYTVDAPANLDWSKVDNGTYTIGVVGNVTDIQGNPVVADPAAATFTVDVADAPVATLSLPATITTDGGNSEAIVITYTDPGATLPTPIFVAGNSISTSNISIQSPNSTPITITGVSPSFPSNGSPVVVTYTASLPAGKTWNSVFNGAYIIKLNGTVKNTAGTAIVPVATLGTFNVATPDTHAPTAQVTATPVLQGLAATTQIVVDYIDDTAINSASVAVAGTAAITVTDNATGESLLVLSQQIVAGTANDAKIVPVIYTLEQPNGQNFSPADNGSYTIALTGSPAVTDLVGHAEPANPNLGVLVVDVGDTVRPTGTVTAAPVLTSAITGETITFVLTAPATTTVLGSTDIKVSTIKLNSLSVVGSNGVALKPSSLSLSSGVNAQTVTASYVAAAPNGTFAGVDDGIYTVTLNGVTDVAGLAVLPSSVTTTFQVAVTVPQNRQFTGQFGIFNGKMHKLRFYDVPLGTHVTVTARGGQGGLIQEGDGSLTMNINDFGGGLTVTVQTNNGRPINLDNITVNGTLTNFTAMTANLVGTFQVSGNVNKMTLRQIVGTLGLNGELGTLGVVGTPSIPAVASAVGTTGTLVATGSILNLKILRAVTDAQILSGVNFGTDGIFGTNPNTLVDDDIYTPGFIGSVDVGGAYTDSVVAAGAAPGVDGVFGFNPITQTSDDVRAGATASIIQSLTATGADLLTRFEAGQFGNFKFQGQPREAPNPALDNRFLGL
jgi:hypothetical protein